MIKPFIPAAALALGACVTVVEVPAEIASLKLVPDAGAPTTYCQRRTQGATNVVDITFLNDGTADYAGGDRMSVTFGERVFASPIPAIAQGDTVTLAVPIPPECFSPDCKFTIAWANQPEVQGLCLG